MLRATAAVLSAFILLAVICAARGPIAIVFAQDGTAVQKESEADLWKSAIVYYIPFRAQTYGAITPETIQLSVGYPMRFSGRSQYELFQRALTRRLPRLSPEMKLDRQTVRLLVVTNEERVFVDSEGVVKTPTEEYMLKPSAFLDLSDLLRSMEWEDTKRRNDREKSKQ